MIHISKKQIDNPDLLNDCKSAIQKVSPNAEVVLFGSRARGHEHMYSDYDLLVLIDEQADIAIKERLISEIYPLELQSEQMVSLIVYNKQQWNSMPYKTMPLHVNIDQEGIVI